MLTGHLDTEKRVLILEYPKRARLPKNTIPVRSTDHAVSVWTIQAKKYMFETLRRYVLQRQTAMQSADGRRYAQAMQAVDKALLMLMSSYEARLDVMCARLLRDREWFEVLAPGTFSRFYLHYEEVILPIFEWCETYLADNAAVPTKS